MTFADRIAKLQGWCRRHGVPYLHGCVWDRECRSEGAPPRIALMAGRTMMFVDLPGYWREIFNERPTWHWRPFFGYHRQPKDWDRRMLRRGC